MRSSIITLFYLSLLCCGPVFAVETLIYPKTLSAKDQRDLFPVKLLEKILAVTHSDQNTELRPSEYEMGQAHALKLLYSGRIQIVWSGTSASREAQFRAIQIPIFKGRLGWRVMMVESSNRDLLKNVETFEDLRTFSVLVGEAWPERDLYQVAGMQVHTAIGYEALFTQLIRQRAEIFPRSVMEISREKTNFAHLDMVIEPYVLLRYPYHLYFFVNKQNIPLAQRIETGFRGLIANGDFDRLFDATFGADLQKLQLDQRRVIDLPMAEQAAPASETRAIASSGR